MTTIDGDETTYNKASSDSGDLYYTSDSNKPKYYIKITDSVNGYGTYSVYSDDSFSDDIVFTDADFTIEECE
jgi:hypothetical protein